MFRRLATNLLSALLALPVTLMIFTGSASAEAALIMAEEPGCIWCKRWNSEIGPIYPKTSEGQAARCTGSTFWSLFPKASRFHAA